jgi:hypothetical protein
MNMKPFFTKSTAAEAAKSAPAEPVPAVAPDAILAGLHARADELEAERGRLMRVFDEYAALEADIAGIDANLRDVGVAERADVERWATQGARGEPPALREAQRRALEHQRALAVAKLGAANDPAAVARRDGVKKRLDEVDRELRDVRFAIYAHKVATSYTDVEARAESLVDEAKAFRKRWQTIIAFGTAIADAIATAVARKDHRTATLLRMTKAQFDALPPPDLKWTKVEVDELAAAVWKDAFR